MLLLGEQGFQWITIGCFIELESCNNQSSAIFPMPVYSTKTVGYYHLMVGLQLASSLPHLGVLTIDSSVPNACVSHRRGPLGWRSSEQRGTLGGKMKSTCPSLAIDHGEILTFNGEFWEVWQVWFPRIGNQETLRCSPLGKKPTFG